MGESEIITKSTQTLREVTCWVSCKSYRKMKSNRLHYAYGTRREVRLGCQISEKKILDRIPHLLFIVSKVG